MKTLPVFGIREFAEDLHSESFYANTLPVHLQDHKFVNTPHRHSTFIAVFFTAGSGEHLVDFDTYPVAPGSVFLLQPGQAHSWKLSSDVDGFVFFHTQEFYESVFVQKKMEDYPFFFLQKNFPLVQLDEKEVEKIAPLFREIYDEFVSRKPAWESKVILLADLVYIELTRAYRHLELPSPNISPQYVRVQQLQKLIDSNFTVLKFPYQYAELMNMTTRHLSRICQETIQKSTNDLILNRIILEAKRMLVHSDVTVNEVAYQLGYEDYSHFVRLFKNKVGLTPKEFQRQVHKI